MFANWYTELKLLSLATFSPVFAGAFFFRFYMPFFLSFFGFEDPT